MSVEITTYKVGKFQLPRAAHVVQVSVELKHDQRIGMVSLGEDMLPLWPVEVPKVPLTTVLAPVCPYSKDPVDDSIIKRMVRSAAETGDVLHMQLTVTSGANTKFQFHAFATVPKDFKPDHIKFSLMQDVQVSAPTEES